MSFEEELARWRDLDPATKRAIAYYEEWSMCYRYNREVEELVDECQRRWKKWARH